MTLLEALNQIPILGQLLPYAALITFMASILDASIPQVESTSKWNIPRKVINYLALSLGNAQNKIPGEPIKVKEFTQQMTIAKP